jgi:Ca2+-binding EF-hand superfamily protein
MLSLRNAVAAIVSLAGLALLAACADSAPPAAAPAANNGTVVVDDRRLLRFFGLMDEDGSGTISRPEFQTGKGSVFLAMDADGSMALTPKETRLKPEAFALLAGGDGMVDGEEFIAADIAQFEKIDANGDREIAYQELRDYMAKYE